MKPENKIDKSLVRDRFERSFRSGVNAAVVQPRMASRLVDLMKRKLPDHPCSEVLELGCGTSSMIHEVLEHMSVDRWMANDLVPVQDLLNESIKSLEIKHFEFIEGDMEKVDLPGGQDLIISNAAFQWLSEPEVFLASLIEKLVPGGVLAFSTFGHENLREVRELTGVSLNYLPSAEYSSILSHDGRIICLEEDLSTVTFDTPQDVLRHLSQTGVNALKRESWSKTDFRSFIEGYISRFGRDGKVELTYHPVYVIFQREGAKG